jgi:hypothetical protein
MVDCAFTLLGRARWDKAIREQMTFPRRHGGLRRASLLQGHAAFVSTAVQTEWAMASGPAEFPLFEAASRGLGLRLWLVREDLHDAGAPRRLGARCGHQGRVR